MPIVLVGSSMGHSKPDITLKHYFEADSNKVESFMKEVI
jgi:hypothetical protein